MYVYFTRPTLINTVVLCSTVTALSHDSHYHLHIVSGEANFAMGHTGLTVGGFTQPIVARTLIEIQANIEKGFCQRFLWVVPKPVAIPLDELQQVDREFSTAIGKKAALCVLVR